ncbi:MAG: Gfo/Idh/MocA family oxidoreductase [Anaerolineales bacterium]|jgi:myo-inositol 2-dehydrogenase/D-chiro-inositol 1-dehydrogenase/scyllo-inositol 2-dehydrogenase (NAD+)
MKNKLQVGLLGCGGFAATLIAPFNEFKDAEIAAVYNRTYSKAEKLGRELGVPSFSSYEVLLQNDNVDGVLINTSHDQHYPMALAAAAAGKHIYCEKPMALTVEECQGMIDAAGQHGVKLFVGHVARLLPLFKRVKQLIDEGIIGKPVAAAMTNYLPVKRLGWWTSRSLSGGLLHSPASHEVDYLNFLFGEASSVYAEAAPQILQHLDYEDTMFVNIQYKNGAIGSVAASLCSIFPVQLGNIVGEYGGLQYDMYSPEGGLIEYQCASGEKIKEVIGDFGIHEGVRCELRNFIDWVLYDAQPLLTADGGLRTVEIIQAAYQSVASGQPIKLPLPR